MYKYVIKRLILMIPVILGVTFLVFSIVKMAPGDPVQMVIGDKAVSPEAIEEIREELGLNKPFLVQYGMFLRNMVRGDFGNSYITKRPIATDIAERFPVTFKLAFFSMLISLIIAIPVGIISATHQYSLRDNVSMVACLLGVSIPNFWLGLMLILLFSVRLGWLPSIGQSSWLNFVMPTVTLGVGSAANIARMMRSSLLEVIRQDYIRTAKAKGVKQGAIIRKHAMKNALMPVITVVGLQFGMSLMGAIITETVFTMSGTGRLLIDGIRNLDMPAVLGCVTVFALCYCMVNLIVDLLYGFLDPRVRAQYSS